MSFNLTVTKLSKLQRFVLKAAVCNRWNRAFMSPDAKKIAMAAAYGLKPYTDDSFIDLYKSEIMEGYFDFIKLQFPGEIYYAIAGDYDQVRNFIIGTKRFDPKYLGGEKYQSAHASISRATNRLKARGLITQWVGSYWSGLRLTEEGVEIAERLARSWLPKEESGIITKGHPKKTVPC
jgi:hypothetical protein